MNFGELKEALDKLTISDESKVIIANPAGNCPDLMIVEFELMNHRDGTTTLYFNANEGSLEDFTL
jgi:hypothetical protein